MEVRGRGEAQRDARSAWSSRRQECLRGNVCAPPSRPPHPSLALATREAPVSVGGLERDAQGLAAGRVFVRVFFFQRLARVGALEGVAPCHRASLPPPPLAPRVCVWWCGRLPTAWAVFPPSRGVPSPHADCGGVRARRLFAGRTLPPALCRPGSRHEHCACKARHSALSRWMQRQSLGARFFA